MKFSAALLIAVGTATHDVNDHHDDYYGGYAPPSYEDIVYYNPHHDYYADPYAHHADPYYGDDYGHYDNHADYHDDHHDDYHDDDHYSDHHDDYHTSDHYSTTSHYSSSSDHDHHDHHDHHDYVQPEPEYYHVHDNEGYGNVPSGDFTYQVHDFNEWEEIWDQGKYEWRLQQEADLMVSLEAMREALVELDHDIDDLESCISDNNDGIDANHYGIHENDSGISDNDHEIDHQQDRVDRLQRQCRDCQERLDVDRDFLVLHCQQFAFAPDMVGACADILTCDGTQLPYRADIFNGNYYGRVHEPKVYNEPEDYDHEHEHVYEAPEPSSKPPVQVGHYTQDDVIHANYHDHHYGHH